jgi:aryl-alcohol dehydrogenase-like predicted oxidoreductase
MDQTPSSKLSSDIRLGGDLPVARLGFGAMRITGPGIWGEPADRSAACVLVRRAVELGVRFIDTADAYGPAVSESILAEALHPYPAGLVIGTKGGLVRGGPGDWRPNGRPEHLKAACEASLRRLKLDRIDLYQLHSPDPAVPLEESVGALKKLQEEGKIRHIGLSNVNLAELDRASKIATIVSVQNRYSLFDRASERVLEACQARNLAFIPWYPLGAGELAHHRALSHVATEQQALPAQVALAWLLQRSPLMLPIPGTSSLHHLEENVAAAQITLTETQFKLLADEP